MQLIDVQATMAFQPMSQSITVSLYFFKCIP